MSTHQSTEKPRELRTRLFEFAEGGRIRCNVCPRYCCLRPGQSGLCSVRHRVGDEIVLAVYGRPSAVAIDPIEKKPLYHFYPGSTVWSFGTVGCNLTCKFCQNAGLSRACVPDHGPGPTSPTAIARAARDAGCHSVAFTYNEPTVFLEYAVDVADACHELGIETVSVTSGYITEAARTELYSHIDAANVDLKAFTDEFYRRLTGARLAPVLDTLRYLRQETQVWVEITTLLIPGYNDSEVEIGRLCDWVAEELGASVPIHFSAFHPSYRMLDTPPTPASTLNRARQIAQSAGLRYAYTGNVRDVQGSTTYCPSCRAEVLVREGFGLRSCTLDLTGHCQVCGASIAGVFGRVRSLPAVERRAARP